LPAASRAPFLAGVVFGGLVSSGLCLAVAYGATPAGLIIGITRPALLTAYCFAGAVAATGLAVALRGRVRRFPRAFLLISCPVAAVPVAAALFRSSLSPLVRAVMASLVLIAAAGIIVPVLVLFAPQHRRP